MRMHLLESMFFFLLLSSMLVLCYAMLNLLQVVFFLVYTFSAAAVKHLEDFCNVDTYGRPEYSSCVFLLYGNRQRPSRNKGIFNIDTVDHGFLLPFFAGPDNFTVDQWKNRVTLPEVWDNGTSTVPRSIVSIVGRQKTNSPADEPVH